MLTQRRLRAVLHYDPDTGTFTWTEGRWKGKTAGTRHDHRGFVKVSIDRERYLLHRLSCLWMTGLMPRRNIEHIDGDHDNNRWSNLHGGDRFQPRRCRAPWCKPIRLKCAFRTVDTYAAMVWAEGTVLNLGTFTTAEGASAAAIGAVQHAREMRSVSPRS